MRNVIIVVFRPQVSKRIGIVRDEPMIQRVRIFLLFFHEAIKESNERTDEGDREEVDCGPRFSLPFISSGIKPPYSRSSQIAPLLIKH
jgi:hypothetical protein